MTKLKAAMQMVISVISVLHQKTILKQDHHQFSHSKYERNFKWLCYSNNKKVFIHPEVVHLIDTDSFIMCLRRFVGTSWKCKNAEIFSLDQRRSLTKAFWRWTIIRSEHICKIWVVIGWYGRKIHKLVSYFGGIWKCQISFARAVLGSPHRTHGSNLNDEALNTLLKEVNSRSLTETTNLQIAQKL